MEEPIFVKALAIGEQQDETVLLFTLDNCGISSTIYHNVTRRLQELTKIAPGQVAICSSHTHHGPMLNGVLPLLFGQPIPAEQQSRIDRYTAELTVKIVEAGLIALKTRFKGSLSWNVGRVTFASNRRQSEQKPVDHSLPVLRVIDEQGKLRVILARYACHATSLPVDLNRLSGDWPGYAQAALEREFPGAVAMIAIGCGADSKPMLSKTVSNSRQQGEQIAHEVKRLVRNNQFQPVTGKVTARIQHVDLPFAKLPTREEWLERTRSDHIYTAYHAQVHLERLERGEEIPKFLRYPIQTWTFGDDLAMIFLAGEVVVDYQHRLEQEFDKSRLWVNAYTNEVPCYIASERTLNEGGYETDRSMIYYDRPTRFAPGLEEIIMEGVKELLTGQFGE